MRVNVLGVGFDDIAFDQAVFRALELLDNDNKTYVVTPNPEIVWKARKDETLRLAVNNAELVLADGVGIVLGARILGTPLLSGRIPGIDFASSFLKEMAQSGRSLFLLGAKPGVAEQAGQKLKDSYPGLIIAGSEDGYFSGSRQVVEKINSTRPDVLFVCLGSPKQELWMAEFIRQLQVKLCVGLGGSLDVFAGKVKRAPAFFQKMGLEWLYRLFIDPRRIKRMAVLPLYVVALVWNRIIGDREQGAGVKRRGLRK